VRHLYASGTQKNIFPKVISSTQYRSPLNTLRKMVQISKVYKFILKRTNQVKYFCKIVN
jgi:hypothetical protein